jgi:hypothetical protein
MSTEQWIWLAYGVGCVVLLIPIARWLIRNVCEGDTDPFDLALAALLTICVVWVWPLLIPGWWVYRVLTLDARDGTNDR